MGKPDHYLFTVDYLDLMGSPSVTEIEARTPHMAVRGVEARFHRCQVLSVTMRVFGVCARCGGVMFYCESKHHEISPGRFVCEDC